MTRLLFTRLFKRNNFQMKTLSMFTLLFLVSISIMAQDDKPKREFIFKANSSKIDVNRGESKGVDVAIIKSKSFEKSTAKLTVGSTVPAGISVQYTPEEGRIDQSTVVITATQEAKPGEYQILLNCMVQAKTKGIIVKVNVL